jgi:hypothetical protein
MEETAAERSKPVTGVTPVISLSREDRMLIFEDFQLLTTMTSLLETFVSNHPDVTLSHTCYRQHFYLGRGINIVSSPPQCVRNFVEIEGSPYRFLIVGQVASFKVVEDAVCSHYLTNSQCSDANGFSVRSLFNS